MKYLKINGEHFYNMVINASNRLDEQKDFVNALNVFPVPDGDTGTNMSMTFKAAVKEIENFDSTSIGEMSKKLAKGALMGARGNSGVILSQILRGISKGLENKDEVNAKEFANALMEGSKSAYKAVMRPTEGTILTIIRAAGESAVASSKTDIAQLLDEVCVKSQDMLNKTPEMLPVLKSAKVVDSGGMGLLIILKGLHEALKDDVKASIKDFVSKAEEQDITAANSIDPSDIKFGYCTEFLILDGAERAEAFRDEIEPLGDSIVVIGDEEVGVIKVHIHTNDPGLALSKAVKLGALSKIKIENMREQHSNLLVKEESYTANEENSVDEERKKYGFVAVAAGAGIENIFKDLGVDYVIEGGQTMNPSTEDIMKAVDSINADNIFILPNNKNIIMAANQAVDLAEDKKIIVIPTKTIPQGITCVTMFNPEAEVDENEETLKSAMEDVKTGSITYAVRDTEMDGVSIKEGNILGLIEGKIKEVGEDIFETSEKVLEEMIDEDSELITIFYGKDIEDGKAEEFLSHLEEKYEDLDVQCYKGEQPLFYFIMSVE